MKQLLLTGRILFFVVIYSHLHAQQLPITLYSSREGSPLAGAASVFQDKQGWIWFVSGYDVVRYDGYRFKTYPPTKKTKINYLFGLMQVNDEIWVRGYPNLLKISGDSLVYVESVVPSLVLQHNILHRGKIL